MGSQDPAPPRRAQARAAGTVQRTQTWLISIPKRVALVVAHSFRDEVDRIRVHGRNDDRLIDELPFEPSPGRGATDVPVSNPDTDNGLRKKDDIYLGMGAQPHLEVQTEFETSGILAGRVGNRDGDSACRIDDGDALPCPQEREQVVDERRVAEMDVHGAAVMALPTPGTLSECGRVRPSLQDHNGGHPRHRGRARGAWIPRYCTGRDFLGTPPYRESPGAVTGWL